MILLYRMYFSHVLLVFSSAFSFFFIDRPIICLYPRISSVQCNVVGVLSLFLSIFLYISFISLSFSLINPLLSISLSIVSFSFYNLLSICFSYLSLPVYIFLSIAYPFLLISLSYSILFPFPLFLLLNVFYLFSTLFT